MAAAPIVLDSPYAGSTYAPPTPEDIGAIEGAIVGQLRNALANQIEVAHFPDRPEAYRLTHRVGAALVRYEGSEYGKIDAVDLVVQERTLAFSVTLAMRDLGWAYGGPASGTNPGAYAIIDAVRVALLGFQPNSGCRKMWLSRDRYEDRNLDGGFWIYALTFHTSVRVVENYEAPNFPLFTTGKFLEQNGQTSVFVAPAQYTFNASNEIQLPYLNVGDVIVAAIGGAPYSPATDYSVAGSTGIITRLASGLIPADATVSVSYCYAEIVTALASGGSAPTSPTN